MKLMTLVGEPSVWLLASPPGMQIGTTRRRRYLPGHVETLRITSGAWNNAPRGAKWAVMGCAYIFWVTLLLFGSEYECE